MWEERGRTRSVNIGERGWFLARQYQHLAASMSVLVSPPRCCLPAPRRSTSPERNSRETETEKTHGKQPNIEQVLPAAQPRIGMLLLQAFEQASAGAKVGDAGCGRDTGACLDREEGKRKGQRVVGLSGELRVLHIDGKVAEEMQSQWSACCCLLEGGIVPELKLDPRLLVAGSAWPEERDGGLPQTTATLFAFKTALATCCISNELSDGGGG